MILNPFDSKEAQSPSAEEQASKQGYLFEVIESVLRLESIERALPQAEDLQPAAVSDETRKKMAGTALSANPEDIQDDALDINRIRQEVDYQSGQMREAAE
jgi:hypothetical protein